MDRFVERRATPDAQREATHTEARKEKRQKGWEKEGETREGPGGRRKDKEEEK